MYQGLANINQSGVFQNDGTIAHTDYFQRSVVADSLKLQFIAQHPASVDASNTNIWYDLSKNKSNASMFNSPAWDGYSYSFNGTNQFATYPWPFSGDESLNFSIEFWAKASANPDLYVVGSSNPGTYIRMLYTASGRYILYFVRTALGTMQYSTDFVPFTVGEVEHIVCVRNYDKLFIYRNGVLIAPQSTGGFFTDAVSIPLNFIGRYVSSYFAGALFYYALYGKSLSPSEISYNYNNNKARFL